jgi:hypothetical protein
LRDVVRVAGQDLGDTRGVIEADEHVNHDEAAFRE